MNILIAISRYIRHMHLPRVLEPCPAYIAST